MPRIILSKVQNSDLFYSALKDEFTEPVGAPNLARYRLIDMFMSATDQIVKESIIKSFCTQDQHLRIVISTIAFGMGVDCQYQSNCPLGSYLRCTREWKSWKGWTGCLCYDFKASTWILEESTRT